MVKIGINGFGRIGRLIVRHAAKDRRDLKVVAINARASSETLAHLLKYDSVHGVFNKKVTYTDNFLVVAGNKIRITRETESCSTIPWDKSKVDVVIEATGKFKDKKSAWGHIEAGAKKVIIGAPGKGVDATFVYGVNHEMYDPQTMDVVSNASCTTNCLAPVVKVLHDAFTIEKGLMTTIHSFTMSQRILDGTHKDLRRARTASMSMIPTTTGAAKAVTQVIPELAGKLDGFSIRVPTPNVSIVDFTCNVAQAVTVEKVNAALKRASRGALKGIMAYTEEPLVSVDYTSSLYSAVVDGPLTEVMDGNLVKVLAWYDNESGYAARLVDMAYYIGKKKK